jgi:ferredoxin
MMIKKVNKEGFKEHFDKLKKEYNIAAPVLMEKGKKELIEYGYVDDFSDIIWDQQPDSSPKNIIFPQNNLLGNDFEGHPAYDKQQSTLVLGVRSCDLEAVKVLDQVFIEDEMYVDESYKKRRDKTIMVGISCPERQGSCFCDTLGLDPVESDYAPIYMYKEGDEFWIKVKDSDYEEIFSELPEGEPAKLEELIEKRRDKFAKSSFDLDIPIPLPEKEMFEADIWEEMAEKCLGCGVCTYYCPTCYCFNFFWEGEDGESTKYKNWDSCMFASYSVHASGHNPRDGKDKRYRNRIMHKFSYHPLNYEGLGCVGCGRCIDRCPVNLDIREALKLTEQYLLEKGGAESEKD